MQSFMMSGAGRILLFLFAGGLSEVFAGGTVYCELPGLGVVRGRTLRSANNASFAAFEGVPYAKPPVGQLRFQPAQPADRFMFLDARAQRNPCPYLNDKMVLVGAEDCLYLSVYTPKVDEDLAMPVLVVLPGEDWTRGYAGRWKPHRLVDRGLVVVTVQSRLGALGFLSTGDASVPGNLGLKDERLALRWVNKNIRSFGGNPGRVTLAGVGAGAAATMLHTLSAPGLFQRAITVSGSALSPWSLAEDAVDEHGPARLLAKALSCDQVVDCVNVSTAANATNAANRAANITASAVNATSISAVSRPANNSEMVACLRTRTVDDVVFGTARLQGWAGLPPSPFGPVVERGGGNDSFLVDSPRRLLEARATTVPVLIALARSEGLQSLGQTGGLLNSSSHLAQLDADWGHLAPVLLAFNTTPAEGRTAAAAQLRGRYMDAKDAKDAKDIKEGLLQLYGDRHVVAPALRAATHLAGNVFLYRFAWSHGTSAITGPAGGSDAGLLLMQPWAAEAERLPAQRAMASDILDVWASFIDTGVPKVGNTTLPRISAQNVSAFELPYVELVRPGEQRVGNWSIQELFAFWDGLPLLENQKPPSTPAGGQTDSRRSERSTSSNSWQNFSLPLLITLQGFWIRFLVQ